MHQLQDAAEPDAEKQRAGDGKQRRAELMRSTLDKDAPQKRRRLGRQTVVVRKVLRQRVRVGIRYASMTSSAGITATSTYSERSADCSGPSTAR